MINFKNLIENIIYMAVVATFTTISTLVVLDSVEGMIKEAINKETTAINNRIDKIKTNKGTTSVTYDNKIKSDTLTIRKRWFNRVHKNN